MIHLVRPTAVYFTGLDIIQNDCLVYVRCATMQSLVVELMDDVAEVVAEVDKTVSF